LTGQVPFEGATRSDAIAAILEREPLPLTRHETGLPDFLQSTVTKALTKDREARYQTIKEVESDLRSLKQRLMFQEEFDRPAEIHNGANGTAHAATRKRQLPKA